MTNRHDVVIDGLRQTNDGEAVVILSQIGGQIGGGGISVVTTDGVQNVNPVGNQTIGGNLERVVAFGDQTTLYEVGGVGQLDPRVANRGSTKTLEDLGILANGVGDLEEVSLEQALVAVLVGDDLDLRCYLGVALDQSTDRGG